MADDVTTQSATLASVPAGGTYAMDLIAGVGYFRQKLTLGRDGVNTADAAGRDVGSGDGALFVDQRPLVVRKSVTPTVSNGAIYALKDQVGGLMTFSNAARGSGFPIELRAVQILDKGQQMAALDLLLFDRSITASADNAICAPSDADMAFCVGGFAISAGYYADLSTNSVASVTDIGLTILPNGTDLFGLLVARSTPTYTSTSDLVVTLTLAQL